MMSEVFTRSPTASSILDGTPYVSYSYAYPHKLAYRTLQEPVSLKKLWAEEDRSALFLYLHIPFCEYRCGFCNLFTLSQPDADLPKLYLDQLASQAIQLKQNLGEFSVARLAIGGGTPTYLNDAELRRLFWILTEILELPLGEIPISCEVSPQTSTPERLEILKEFHVDRVSIGVQSFDSEEAKAMGRPQRPEEAHKALEFIRTAGFPILNLDLIYGADSQTPQSFVESVQTALEYQPEELYLYPLYVRPLTGLGKTLREWDDDRLNCYNAARDELLANGYEQVSMRMFRKQECPTPEGPIYCCQTDGMLGLGCGARSYTSLMHYCTEYAVAQKGVTAILNEYLKQEPRDFDFATHGIALNEEESKRRFLIQSLLQVNGLQLSEYDARFQTSPLQDFSILRSLIDANLAKLSETHLQLTQLGMACSDSIGPALYSDNVKELIEAAEEI